MNNVTYYLKIHGKSNIPSALEIGHNYRLVADCSIVKESKSDNEDGSFDLVYTMVPVTCEVSKDNGATIKAKDPRKNSVKFRKSCWAVANNNNIDDERFYDFATSKCIGMLDTLSEEFKNL